LFSRDSELFSCAVSSRSCRRVVSSCRSKSLGFVPEASSNTHSRSGDFGAFFASASRPGTAASESPLRAGNWLTPRLIAREDVRVAVHRELDRGMPHHLLDDLRMHVRRHQPGTAGVAQGMGEEQR